MPPLIVLDDDPTGTQALTSARVVCDPSTTTIAAAAHADIRSLHVITNSRALAGEDARKATFEAAEAAASAVPGARIVLRGDSTLRAHLLEEYLGYIDAITRGAHLPLVLVLALPAAGRVTVHGRQLIIRNGDQIPVERTEYARDPDLGYSTGRLREWAEERSDGFFDATRGIDISLEQLRKEGPRSVVDAVAATRDRLPGVVVVDAEADSDLRIAAAGIRGAPPTCVRCAPALVGVLADNTARALVEAEPIRKGILVVCGSWVPLADRQLRALERASPGSSVEVDAAKLVGESSGLEIGVAATACRSRVARTGIAILSTPRKRDPALATPALRFRLAQRLAVVVRQVAGEVGAVVTKGGITSAVTMRDGLQATYADVVGPIASGVALWLPLDGPHAGTPLAIVPGNVGNDRLLADVVAKLRAAWTGGASRAGVVH